MTTCDTPQQRAISRDGFFRRTILRALSGMQRGRLTIELPDGGLEVLGDGIGVHGFDGHATIRIRDERFFRRCFFYGDIGLAEAFIHGDWETDDIAAVISWFVLNADQSPSQSASGRRFGAVEMLGWLNRLRHRIRLNTVRGSRKNIADHYDLSNDFFALFLDPTMTYSSAFFTSEDQTLESAQMEKYDRLCKKLRLRASDHVLEIGGGWGGFSRYAVQTYGCKVTTTTISKAQFDYASAKNAELGFSERIELLQLDYRKLSGRYDKIVSIEMLESVGHEFLETYFAKCHELLTPEGVLAIQVITCADNRYDKLRKGVDFIQKHIFPGSLILSMAAINRAINRTGDLFLHDMEDMGTSYARTLGCWHQAFNERLAEVRKLGFDERFVRIWNYYLAYCQAAFAMRHNSVVQAVYTRANNYSL
ncbi:MAG TPA: cyclopropane-fatty-acyl-phospholipid synthase family protein [Thermoanaerobaculia bacterium]|nr:cyclopropane-fatty-acyl-phospholipid synthase family protein [Thermoanaerobaculia bacterium]